MTDPKLAFSTELGRYYVDPGGGPPLVSVTNVLSTIAKDALLHWAVKLTAEWAADHRMEVARRAVADRAALLAEMRAVHETVRDEAADLGTRIHARAEAHVLGAPYPADPEVEPYARQLAKFFALWQVDLGEHVVAAELTFANRSLGYAGTGDLLVWLPTGPGGARELWLVDYKTSATRPASSVYPEQALQVTALRRAEVVFLPDDTDGPVPPIQRTAVLNLRRRSHALVEMPSGPAEWRAFRGALAVTQWLHGTTCDFPAMSPPPAGPDERKAA